MSDIENTIKFKKENDDEVTFEDKYVHLTALEDKNLIFKFEAVQDDLKEVHEFFDNLKNYEHVNVDIGATGEISCYFKSLSPIVGSGPKKVNGEHLNGIFILSLQQLVDTPDSQQEQGCQNCALMQDGVCSIKDNNGIAYCDDYKSGN